jgi:hypothetical protein
MCVCVRVRVLFLFCFLFCWFTVGVADALTGSVFDLAHERKAPGTTDDVAGYWWWGAGRSGQDLDRTLGLRSNLPVGARPGFKPTDRVP